MNNLLKADFFRVFKSKLTYISFSIAHVFPLLIAVLIFVVNLFIIYTYKQEVGTTEGVENALLTSSMFIKSSLSISSNIGIAIPIFSSIFINMDISNGSLRNKIIYGKNRSTIYLSHLVVSICYNVALITIYFLSTVLFTSIFLPYGTEFNTNEVLNIIYLYINSIMSFAFIATITAFFSFVFKSVAPTIILTIVVMYVVTFGSLLQLFANDYIVYAIPLFANGTYTSSAVLGSSGDFDLVLFFEGLLSLLAFGTLNTILGIKIFEKSDIK